VRVLPVTEKVLLNY